MWEFGVKLKFMFHNVVWSRGTDRSRSGLTFCCASFLSPPIPHTAETQTLAPIPWIMRLIVGLILGLTILVTNAFGRKKGSVSKDTAIFADPMIYPEFPGGQSGLKEYIDKNFNWTQGQLTVEGNVFV